MGFGDGLLRTIVVILNTALILVGIGSIIGPIVILVIYKGSELSTVLRVCTIGVMIMGALLVITTIVGCCAACQKSSSLSQSFIAFMVLIILAQIGMGIYAVVAKPVNTNEDYLAVQGRLNQFIVSKNDTDINGLLGLMSCCGWNGPDDYKNLTVYPKGCCKINSFKAENKMVVCGKKGSGDEKEIFSEGCKVKSKSFYKLAKTVGIAFLFTCGSIEIISVLLGVYMQVTSQE